MINKEDWQEPRCPLCEIDKEDVKMIPVRRILEKVDTFYDEKDYDGAERVIFYWINEAKDGRDLKGELSMHSELIGIYRKTGQYDKGFAQCEEALSLLDKTAVLGKQKVETLINIATFMHAAGEPGKALPVFEKALKAYSEATLDEPPTLAGLYNNMSLTLTVLEKFDEAADYYKKAIEISESSEEGLLDAAISYLNLANTLEQRDGLINASDEIENCLDSAEKIFLDEKIPHNGYFAFVCEKCAPTFNYYGRFFFGEELERIAKKFYEGN